MSHREKVEKKRKRQERERKRKTEKDKEEIVEYKRFTNNILTY